MVEVQTVCFTGKVCLLTFSRFMHFSKRCWCNDFSLVFFLSLFILNCFLQWIRVQQQTLRVFVIRGSNRCLLLVVYCKYGHTNAATNSWILNWNSSRTTEWIFEKQNSFSERICLLYDDFSMYFFSFSHLSLSLSLYLPLSFPSVTREAGFIFESAKLGESTQ